MEPLTRVLTIFTLSLTAVHGVYTLTIAGLWWYVAERIVWWAGLGGGLIALLAVGSWWVERATRPTHADQQDGGAAPAPPVVAGRVGPRASPLSGAKGSRRAA